jgi:2'-hydroxyisoflavone reductase
MEKSRRRFTKNGLALALGMPLIGSHLLACQNTGSKDTNKSQEVKPLKILILGGTSFLGPHQIAYAISRGHKVSTFTRGKTKPSVHQEVFDQVESLIGDRNDNLTALENRSWDIVIDNSGRNVEWTKKTAELLKDKVEQYIYTSSTGVYYPYFGNDIAEDTKLVLEMPDGIEDEIMKMEYAYGVMKANSELEAINAFGKERSIIVRPTYMIGPADKTDRFIYWPIRLARGGEVLIPGKIEDPVQYVDVRDVAEWMIRLAEQKKVGTYNAVGPATAQTMNAFVLEASKAFDHEFDFVQVDDYEFLMDNNIPYLVPWIMPEVDNFGSSRISTKLCKSNGLTYRKLQDTMKETYDWWYSNAITQEQRDKFELKKDNLLLTEKEILKQWKNRG